MNTDRTFENVADDPMRRVAHLVREIPLVNEFMYFFIEKFNDFLSSSSLSVSGLRNDGFYRVITLRINLKDEMLVMIQVNPSVITTEEYNNERDRIVQWLGAAITTTITNERGTERMGVIKSAHLLENTLGNNVVDIEKQKLVHILGSECISETLLGRQFNIGPASFFQTNTQGAEVLYSVVKAYCNSSKSLKLWCENGFQSADATTSTVPVPIPVGDGDKTEDKTPENEDDKTPDDKTPKNDDDSAPKLISNRSAPAGSVWSSDSTLNMLSNVSIAQSPSHLLLDVCCGTGTIGLCVGGNGAKILGIEMNAQAVEDAKQNAKLYAIFYFLFLFYN